MTTSGRLRRVTCWVPLEKVQSFREVQGPVQRRLRLASVHLDTAGGNVHAVLRDRDAGRGRRRAGRARRPRAPRGGGLTRRVPLASDDMATGADGARDAP